MRRRVGRDVSLSPGSCVWPQGNAWLRCGRRSGGGAVGGGGEAYGLFGRSMESWLDAVQRGWGLFVPAMLLERGVAARFLRQGGNCRLRRWLSLIRNLRLR